MARSEPAAEFYDRENFEPRYSVGHLVARVRAEMLDALDRAFVEDEQLSKLGVSGSQFVVIASLAYGKRAGSDLCKVLSYDPGAMTRMIDRLEAKGLIQRERCTEDRRLVYLELTEKGRQAWPRMREISCTVQNKFLGGLTPVEGRELERLLQRLLGSG